MEALMCVVIAVAAVLGAIVVVREILSLRADLERVKSRQHAANIDFINNKYDVLDALRVAGLRKTPKQDEQWVKD